MACFTPTKQQTYWNKLQSLLGAETLEIEAFRAHNKQPPAPLVPQETTTTFKHLLPLFCSPIIFTQAHNQTVLCPVPPYDPSMMMPACCCRDLTRYEHSEPAGREAAGRGGQRSTGPFPVPGVLPRAAALSVPWRTRAKQETRVHNLQPSSLCRSS